MDAQGRGRAEGADPADQWVLNPQTGDYELRLDGAPAPPPPPVPRQRTPQAPGPRPGGPRPGGPRDRDGEQNDERNDDERDNDGTSDGPRDTHRRRRDRPKRSRKRKALMWTGGVMGLVLVGGSAFAYYWYDRLNGNIGTVDIGDVGSATVLGDGPANILVIGNDVRTGEGNEAYGNRDNVTGHADTTLLFHVAGDRSNATVVSIPRDLMTEIPDCETRQSDGSTKTIPGSQGTTRFNESYGVEGRDPGCTMRTVEELTGLDVDHFMMFDFNAVKTLSTAVGGVEVCLEKPLKDTDGGTKLDLPAGKSTIQGEEALSFLRNRHGLKNESDLDRIGMQQKFVASMLRRLKEDTLSSPSKMLDVADAATKSLTVDQGIGSASKLLTLARELGKIDLKNITLMTLPVVDNPDEPTPVTVVPDPEKAPQVFSMLQDDVSFTEVKKQQKKAKDKQAALLNGPRAEASAVQVDVLNGGGPQGAAGETVAWLQSSAGVSRSANQGNAPAKVARTRLVYAPAQADQARELADLMGLPAAALKPSAKAGGEGPMTLTLGPDFKKAGVPVATPRKVDVPQSRADEKMCKG
ncbi:LCP family protein [Streptomyces pseudogriseolus]|uniref:Cell envelope-related transcriptional attenuator n=3 Tax=Streptomyces TaxID=1883 RepID=M3DRH6_STREZ|nr:MULTISPECIES: LCP family protein [Streptomyces pseudogriseolus group]EMF24207.1 cell envelope-related transcriptional attenuator [Streptomyces gancidicus BKS 13-15]GGS36390.1 LytR family transcriptional regulator [Streptomyces rubiginosus]